MPIDRTNMQAGSTMPTLAWDTLLDLGEADSGPMHARLARALREAVRAGRLPAGSVLPPSRDLGPELGCSRWVVTEAYEQLVAEGYLEARIGSGTRVRAVEEEGSGDVASQRRSVRPRPPLIDMGPGLPDLRHFPMTGWLAALRSVAATLPFVELAYPDRAGHAQLREMLAGYLARVRGAVADPDHVTITTGVTDGVTRICRAMRAAGVAAVAVESPGWGRLREAAAVAGLGIVPISVDDRGLQVERLDALGSAPAVRAVIVSPAHQFPTGSVLAPERRAALLAWAHRADGLILEDDYDAEFRYDRRPVGTMQGTDRSRVVLLGSLSKTLSPALGIGWLVTPPAWTEAVRSIEVRPAAPPLLDQLTFATFLSSGGYDRHMRAARKRYRARRDALVAALAAALPDAHVSGAAAGLHLLVRFDGELAAPGVVERAASRGVHVSALGAYRATDRLPAGGLPVGSGLVLGYGNLGDAEVAAAVAALAAAVADVRAARNRAAG